MKLTDEQIKSIMEKNVITKTLMVDDNLLEKTISDYEKDGWKLINKIEISDRYKVTFQKNA